MKKLFHYIKENKNKFVLFITAILFILSIINFYYLFEVVPISNDECLWVKTKVNEDSTVIEIRSVKRGGITWEAGIRNGDQLLKINGVKIDRLQTATNTLNKLERGEYAEYKVKRDGEIIKTEVKVKKLINIYLLGFSLFAIFWLLVGTIVARAKPEGKEHMIFYKIGVALTLFTFINFVTIHPNNPLSSSHTFILIFLVFWFTATAFIPFLIMNFFFRFPRKYKLVDKIWWRRIYYIIPISLIVISYGLILVSPALGYNPVHITSMVVSFWVSLVLLGLLAGIIILYISYFKLKTKKEKKPILVILIAYTIAITALLYNNFIASTISDTLYNSPEYYTPIILLAIIPISFGFSMFKYSLLDVSEVIKNALFYGVATALIAGSYFLIIYVIGLTISQAIGTEYKGIIAGTVFVVFAFILQSTRDRFQIFITAKFYPEQFAYQNVIMKFSNDVSNIVGINKIIDFTFNTITTSLKPHKFGFFLKEDSNRYNMVREYNFISKDTCFKSDEITFNEILNDKQKLHKAVYADRIDFDAIFPGQAEKLTKERIYTLVPLIIQSRIIGFFLFGVKYSGSQFTDKEIELLNAAANQTATAIENARLYEAEAEKKLLDRDLENARKIQENLLPKVIPTIDNLDVYGRMIPAMQVGGDYFDLIKIDDERLFVVVGDVSGKGLSASFYMSKLQTMVRLYCNKAKSPSEILKEINKQIFKSIERNYFITVSIALFDTANKTVKFCRAGHTELLASINDEMKVIRPKGIGVGLESGEIFDKNLEETELPLSNEDFFLFFSDGVNEASDENNEMYGNERVLRLLEENKSLSTKDFTKKLISDIKRFKGNTKQNDDIAVVAVKYIE